MSSAPTEQDLVELASEVRTFLEERWVVWKRERDARWLAFKPDYVASDADKPVSWGMCRFSCHVLAEALRGAGHRVEIRSGVPTEDMGEEASLGAKAMLKDLGWDRPGGLLGADGRRHSHYWVVVGSGRGKAGFVVDVTADQFGLPVALVCPEGDERYLANLLPREVKSGMADVSKTGQAWTKSFRAWRIERMTTQAADPSECASEPRP